MPNSSLILYVFSGNILNLYSTVIFRITVNRDLHRSSWQRIFMDWNGGFVIYTGVCHLLAY